MALNGLLCADVPLRNYSLTDNFMQAKVTWHIHMTVHSSTECESKTRIITNIHCYSLMHSQQCFTEIFDTEYATLHMPLYIKQRFMQDYK